MLAELPHVHPASSVQGGFNCARAGAVACGGSARCMYWAFGFTKGRSKMICIILFPKQHNSVIFNNMHHDQLMHAVSHLYRH